MSSDEIDFDYKQIHDPIHNTVGLSKAEIEIIDSRAFQRLRNVKQLGLASYVFPGADYTRFSHCIGVCHLTGKMYDAYRKVKPADESTDIKKEKQKYRLAGLLHDIGHYALSHSMEEAIDLYIDTVEKNETSSLIKIKENSDNVVDEVSAPIKPLNHESVGRVILLNDDEIKNILSNYGYSPEDIYNLFSRNGETTNNVANLISSDLDADRLDYLLRSAHYVGLPYGSSDLEYILRQITVDRDGQICTHSKALRTVDHFLLCRYFDYSQVIFHKTVAGFEQVLKKVIVYLIENKKLIYSPDHVIKSIKTGEWYEYDDAHIMKHIKDAYNDDSVPSDIKLMMKSIIERKPPKEVVKIEYIDDLDEDKYNTFLSEVDILESLVEVVSREFDISPNNICVWNNNRLKITKAAKTVNISKSLSMSASDSDNINQSVRIHERLTNSSTPIMERKDSLMSILSEKCLYSARMFIMLDSNQFDNSELLYEKIDEIGRFIRDKHAHTRWT